MDQWEPLRGWDEIIGQVVRGEDVRQEWVEDTGSAIRVLEGTKEEGPSILLDAEEVGPLSFGVGAIMLGTELLGCPVGIDRSRRVIDSDGPVQPRYGVGEGARAFESKRSKNELPVREGVGEAPRGVMRGWYTPPLVSRGDGTPDAERAREGEYDVRPAVPRPAPLLRLHLERLKARAGLHLLQ
jgi:hypothetical protein